MSYVRACVRRALSLAVRLRPHELDGLSGLTMAGKVSLLHAIGRIDLMEWLKEWGLEALADELDELGVEEPSHAVDLLPEEIGAPVSLRAAKLSCSPSPTLEFSAVLLLVCRGAEHFATPQAAADESHRLPRDGDGVGRRYGRATCRVSQWEGWRGRHSARGG